MSTLIAPMAVLRVGSPRGEAMEEEEAKAVEEARAAASLAAATAASTKVSGRAENTDPPSCARPCPAPP